jgi:hypothetical protein
MNRKAPRLAFSLVGTLSFAIGCGSSGKSYPDAKVDLDAHPDQSDAPPPPPDAQADVVTPPTPGTGSKLLVSGAISLIGSGKDTCTNQVPPSGDRWCGFARSSAILGASELWVVNVTQAAAGVTIKCDAGAADPNCLRLSGGLYSDDINGGGFRVNGFDGDTLTYEEVPSRSGSGFLGNIFAWRPGWTAPRQLTTANGLACNGHASSKAVICIDNPVVDAAMTVETVELHAGFLDDQAGGELPLVDTIILQTKDDAAGVRKWGARLSPDGTSVGWSTRTTSAGTEDLQWQKIGDDKSRLMVAPDVDQWTVSADSKKWFWLKTFNFDVNGAPSGTLQSAPYPGGAAPVTIATGVGDYNEAGSTGILYRTKVTTDLGTLLLTPDRDMPATVKMVDTGVAFVFEVTKDGTNATYTKNIQSLATNIFLFDVYVAGAAGVTPCALTKTPIAFLPPTFLAGGTMAAWGRFNNQTGEVEGVATTVAGCSTTKFASDAFGWTAIADEGLVFLDTLNPDPAINEATLRYAKIQNGALPAAGTVVQARAGLEFSTLLPALPAVVYTITSNTSADGLYVNAMLPFAVTTSVPDGGTDTGSGDVGADVGTTTEAGASETGADTGSTDAGAADAPPSG